MVAASIVERSYARMRRGLFASSLVLFLAGFAIPVHGQNPAANKEIVRLYFEEAVNRQKPELVDSLCHTNYRIHLLDSGRSEETGSEQLRSFLVTFFRAFPDIHYTIDDMIAEDDRVVARLRVNGTHRAEIFGIPPAGRRLDNLSEVFFFRIANGKIAEAWRLVDMRNLRMRLQGTSR